jgi:hypothetical protein
MCPFNKRIASRIAVAAELCDSIRCNCDPLRRKDVSGLVFPEIVLSVEESFNHSIHQLPYAALTVTAQVAVCVPAVAVIVADPMATAVTVPSAATVATVVSELDHVTASVELLGVTAAVSFFVPPTPTVAVLGVTETPVAAIKKLRRPALSCCRSG